MARLLRFLLTARTLPQVGFQGGSHAAGMDFFGHQQQARRYSALVLFALAVPGPVLAVNLLVGRLAVLGDLRHGYRHLAEIPAAIYGWTTAVTFALIGFGFGARRRLWELSAPRHGSYTDSTPCRMPYVWSTLRATARTATKHPALRLRRGRRARFAPRAASLPRVIGAAPDRPLQLLAGTGG
jgi:hypothetical protein